MGEQEVILLGAGASKEAGLPTSYEMIEKILEKFEANGYQDYARITKYIIGGLLFQEGVKGNNPLSTKLNVEDFFNAVQLLADRNSLDVAPFLGSWHFKVDEFDTISSNPWGTTDFIEKLFKLFVEKLDDNSFQSPYSSPYSKYSNLHSKLDIDHADRNRLSDSFKSAVEDILPKSGDGAIYRGMADSMIRILKDVLWVSQEDKTEYLCPLIDHVKSAKRSVIATLNYDNCIETAAKSRGLKCITGIDAWSENGIFDISNNDGLILLKLHGSLDWEKKREVPANTQLLPQSIIRAVSPEQMNTERFWPAVIFGQKNKLTAEGPFLDMLRAFQRELFKASKLTVIGYSFGDDHINTYISHWLNQSNKHKLRIIDPKFSENRMHFAMLLNQMKKSGNRNIKIIPRSTSKALMTLYKNA